MVDAATATPTAAGPRAEDRTTAVLLTLASAADRLLANAAAPPSDVAGLQLRLRATLAEAWALLGPHRRPGGGQVERPWLHVYTSDDLPDGRWEEFVKDGTTRMVRMAGPFAVRTVDGNVALCDDGWLAVDTAGHPYPVAADLHAETYRRVSGG